METQTEASTILTIGHSNHSIESFIGLLEGAGITAIADVRSVPYSRRHPQFNRPALKASLEAAGIAYVFLGGHLGARPHDPSCYRNGAADYALIAQSSAFADGVRRVEEGARRYRVALMCAERDPLNCHRTILVARHLQERGATITHLLADGSLEANEATERRLLEITNLQSDDLFDRPDSDKDAIAKAYDRRGRTMAYTGEQTSGKQHAVAGVQS